jgi:aminoglycoside phosphotransferase (APT) family kinase protein
MVTLETAIAGLIASWRGDTTVEQRVFASGDPAAIAACIDGLCGAALGAGVEGSTFAEKSVGIVVGVRLEDGRDVVVKAHQSWQRTLEQVAACVRVQTALHAAGFPAPRPLAGPVAVPSAPGYLTFEDYVDGDQADAHEPSVRTAMANSLAELVLLATPHASRELVNTWFDWFTGPLWPRPHSTLFDFSQPSGAWIDDLAARARGRLAGWQGERVVVGHGDWSVKNLRFRDGRIAAVYDWDSLCLLPEVCIVGAGAVSFPATWYLPVPKAPTIQEVEAFLAEYEAARGLAFTRAERSAIDAATVYAMGYTARCEHRPEAEGEFQRLLRALAVRAGY